MYDYHVHSHFSGDCEELMEDSIREAIKMGGKSICFTDHIDYDYPEPYASDLFELDPNELYKDIDFFKKKYKGKIIIQKGIELGLQRQIIKQCNEFVNNNDLDFVLCSFHTCKKKDLYNGDYFKNKTALESWNIFIEEMIYILNRFTNYSVVGHLDILKRYNEDVRKLPLNEYILNVEKVLKVIIKSNRGIEVNMSGLRIDSNETLPSIPILEMYFKLGGTIITIGSDAHKKEDLYSHYKETLIILRNIGFKEFTIYEKMKPIQVDIERTLDII